MASTGTNTSVHLALAAGAEVPAIVSLINTAFRARGENRGWSLKEEYIEGTRITEDLLHEEMAAKPHASLLVWRKDNVLTGCVWLEPVHRGIWYLGLLAVPPRSQNGGLGRKLLAAAEHWAREHGAGEIQMTVVQVRTTLIEWYQRRGYTLTGQTKPFPYGDNRFGIPKRNDLHFVVLRKRLAGL